MTEVEQTTAAGLLAGRGLVNRDRHVPLYVQIRDCVVDAIKDGSLPVGAQLPSEPEMVLAFGVGRPTVRQAIQMLRQEGLVLTKRGFGTFVAAPSAELSLLGFDGLTRRLDGRGITHSSTVVRTDRVAAPPLQVLSVPDASGTWWSLVRLRHVELDGKLTPLCLETDAFSERRCPDAEAIYFRAGSATAVRQAYGMEIASAEVATRAIAATREVAQHLEVSRGAPILAIERAHNDADGSVAHVATFLMRTDVVPIVDHIHNPAVS